MSVTSRHGGSPRAPATNRLYPPCPDVSYGFGDKLVGDIKYVKGVSNEDDSANMLTGIAARYDQVLGRQGRRRDFLQRPRLAPEQNQLERGSVSAEFRQPLLQRPFVHAMGCQ